MSFTKHPISLLAAALCDLTLSQPGYSETTSPERLEMPFDLKQT